MSESDRQPALGLAKPSRVSSLPAPPRRPRPVETTREEPKTQTGSPERNGIADSPQPATSPPRPTQRRSRKADARPDDQLVPVTLSLPVEICAAMRERVRRQDTTHADTLMDAISANVERLSPLVSALRRDDRSDGLFVRKAPREVEARSTLPFRMRAQNVAVIDRLVDEYGAESRSQLCRAALESFLQDTRS